ncbi:MAG: PP2C family protein-serine/threonine phosphatase [Planctomycetota bacterium]|jgi:serine phosphatase RsbU (regulator of sigma subunit)
MRLTIKLLLISELVLVVAVTVLVVPFWNAMRLQVVANMQDELKAIAATGALQLDGDLHRNVRSTEDGGSAAFATLRARLDEVRRANGIAVNHIYTFYRDGDQMRFAVMLNPRDELFIGESYPIQPMMLATLEEGRVTATSLYADANGEWISAYAPIRDAAGTIVGLLEVDKDSGAYFRQFWRHTRLTVLLGIIALAISSVLGWVVFQRLVIRPVGAIRAGMLALGRREFTHRVSLRTNDELEDLGRTLNDISAQLDVARVVQQGLFPRSLPAHPRYRVAGSSIACDATGGDYYDAFALKGDRVAIVVADVSGHGLGPSLLMASCRSALRGLAHSGIEPGELVQELSRLLRDDLTEGRFITLLYGVLHGDGTFSYANWGHAPAMVVSGGLVHHLASHQPPLGVHFQMDIEELRSTVRLAAGDRLLIATDGLPEALDVAGVSLGTGPIEAVARDATLDTQAVVDRLHGMVVQHCGGPSRTDDVTILCVDRV